MDKFQILVADDHPMFRHGLRHAFDTSTDADVIAEATDGIQAVELALELQPDLILMDVEMPRLSGIDATRKIADAAPHIRVVILTVHEDSERLFAAMRAGARGYVLKGADQDEIVHAVRAVMNGELPLSPAIAQRVMDYFAKPLPAAPPQSFPSLTAREREVLELIAQGLSNAEIARRFTLSDHTVRNHVSNVYSKLQVFDRAQAIVLARKAGMGDGSTGR
jgi:DNA-binding NarL/FixJ family response regulator